MKSMLTTLFTTLTLATAIRAAPSAVATITSTDAFTLSGVRISQPVLSSLPLVAGDQIRDLDAPAVIRFADNTQVTVDKGSSLQLENVGGRTILRLLSGNMSYKPGASPQVSVLALDQAVSQPRSVAVAGNQVSYGMNKFARPLTPPSGKPHGRSKGGGDNGQGDDEHNHDNDNGVGGNK